MATWMRRIRISTVVLPAVALSVITVVTSSVFAQNSTSFNVAPGASFAGLTFTSPYQSTNVAGPFYAPNGLQTTAIIRAGKNLNSTTANVSFTWRPRQAAETWPTGVQEPAGPLGDGHADGGVSSDVLDLNGMQLTGQTDQTSPFVLQLSYLESTYNGPGQQFQGVSEADLFAQGEIALWWRNYERNAPIGLWDMSTHGNYGLSVASPTLVTYYQGTAGGHNAGSWDSFAAQYGVTDDNLGNFLGSWGVDMVSNQAWAVLNHNSEFAVAPEPSSWALAIMAGVAGLVMIRRNRRQVAVA